ncbi:MAG: hypothetical protein KDE53_28560 [Caldilineaceae bacterium]|nr:hypothetical protein [Caldilineaceae bacterium]
MHNNEASRELASTAKLGAIVGVFLIFLWPPLGGGIIFISLALIVWAGATEPAEVAIREEAKRGDPSGIGLIWLVLLCGAGLLFGLVMVLGILEYAQAFQ